MAFSSEELLKAIDIVIKGENQKLKFDKTVEVTIVELKDSTTGEYAVNYQGATFSAFSVILTEIYEKDEKVWMKVPQGDFSNRKTIEGRVKHVPNKKEEESKYKIIEVGPTWDVFYDYPQDGGKGIIAGAEQVEDADGYTEAEKKEILKDKEKYIYSPKEDIDADKEFQNYSRVCDHFRLKADFLTKFLSVYDKGNYGLEIVFYTRGKEERLDDGSYKETLDEVSYRLDLKNFSGSPYALSTYTPQYVVFECQKNYLLGIKSIRFFQEMRPDYEAIIKTAENGSLIEESSDIYNHNILVQNIQFQFVRVVDLSQNMYNLEIKARKGITVDKNNRNVIPLQSVLYYGNKDISGECTFNWYEEDLSVTIGTDNYEEQSGARWKKMRERDNNGQDIEVKEEEKINYDFDMLYIKYQDIEYKKRYKVIATFGNGQTLSEIIAVERGDTIYNVWLEQVTENEEIYLRLKGLKNGEEYNFAGNWYRELPDGSYIQINIEKTDSISISEYLKFLQVTFYCDVFDVDKQVAALNHIISHALSEDDVRCTFKGQTRYQYDANGDTKLIDVEKERTLEGILVWKDGLGASYNKVWIAPDGVEITANAYPGYNPDNSMMQNMYVDMNNILHYHIKAKKDVLLNDNTITLKVVTIDSQEYLFPKEIDFVKDGDQGTNGTTYQAKVRPVDNKNEELIGVNPLFKNDNQRLKCFVYKGNETINDKDGFSFSFSWSNKNVSITNSKTAIETASYTNDSIKGAFVTCKITINDRTAELTSTIYAHYPIPVVDVVEDSSIVLSTNIPKYVMYNPEGINPEFYYDEDLYFKVGKDNLISDGKIKSSNEDVLYIQNKKLVPNPHYMGGKDIPYFTFKYGIGNLYYPVMMYLNTYGNKAINDWDGTSIETSDGVLLAPQIGAGKKENDLFSGVVMGDMTGANNTLGWNIDGEGIYGFKDGIATFGLKSDGTAYFGPRAIRNTNGTFSDAGGWIEMDGSEAVIKGGTSGNSPIMRLFLAKNNKHKHDNKDIAIQVGDSFFVYYDGSIKASDSIGVTGVINATSGYIGNWLIDSGSISQGNTILGSDGIIQIQEMHVKSANNILGLFTTDDGNKAIGFKIADRSFVVESEKAIRLSAKDAVGINLEAPKITLKTSNVDIGYYASSSEIIHIGNSNMTPATKDNKGNYVKGLICHVPPEGQIGIYARFA